MKIVHLKSAFIIKHFTNIYFLLRNRYRALQDQEDALTFFAFADKLVAWIHREILKSLNDLCANGSREGFEDRRGGGEVVEETFVGKLAKRLGDARKLVQRMRRGGFKLELDLQRLDEFGRQLDRSANRVTVGLITSALIVGTSIAMTMDTGPTLFGLPVLGFLGFGTSFTIGLMLLWSILRSGIR